MAAAVVNENNYVQHNPQTKDGGKGIAALFARISKTDPKVRFVRVFEDGDFAFAHNEYDFADQKIAFELFRFEDGLAVEHWDNIQTLAGPNTSGHGMADGTTEISDLHKTEANRALINHFAETVLIEGRLSRLRDFVADDLIQHDPELSDGIAALKEALNPETTAPFTRRYDQIHKVLAEGNFVLCVCEGAKNGVHSGIYDLYRLSEAKIVEHWRTIEAIPPRGKWLNDNGKF